MKSGFTLIELLVVVAIIAVIGAGVAVTYNRLDQRAKTAMEINDIGELTQTIKNWSFLHDWALPNELDSLIDTSDQLYSQMDGSEYGMGTVNGVNGLYAQSGFTLMAEDAPARVLDNLTAAGLNLVYRHDPAQTPANDSTFVPSGMGSGVDTSSTLSVLDTTSSQNSRTRAQAIVNAKSDADTAFAEDDDGTVTGAGTITVTYPQTMNMSGRTITYNENETFNSGAEYTDAYTAANKTLKATPISKLAFVYPGGGAQMMGGMTTAGTSPTALPSSFEFVSGDSQTYTVPTTSEPQRLYGVMQFFERYGLWPLMQKSVFSKVRTVRHQIFQTSADENRRYEFIPPSPITGNGWRGPYLNSVSAKECVLNSTASGGNIVEAVSGSRGVTSGDAVADTEVRLPQPATKYDTGANGGIYRVFYYEHCANEYEGQPIYRRLILMAAIDPLKYDTWDEIKVFAGNRRSASASGAPLNLETGAINAYDDAHGVFFMELLNFDTVYR